MSNARAHVFDLGNVLIFFHPDWFLSRLAAACRPGAAVEQIFLEAFDRADVVRGGDFDHLYPELVGKAGLTLTLDEFRLAWNDVFTRNPPMLDLLNETPRPRVLLSNTNRPHVAWIQEQFPEIFPRFDHVVLSNEVGLAKPDPAIYRYAEALTGLPPERHIFTDDLLENVAAARACGWRAIQFVNAEDYRRQLAELGACT